MRHDGYHDDDDPQTVAYRMRLAVRRRYHAAHRDVIDAECFICAMRRPDEPEWVRRAKSNALPARELAS